MGERDNTDHVTAQLPWLRKLAYLLPQDWHRADDVVPTAITQLYRHWHRVARMDNPDRYARTVLVRSYLGERPPGVRGTRFSPAATGGPAARR